MSGSALEIVIVTGAFPVRSQTFIERKVMGLAGKGHRITVLAGGRGDHVLDPQRVAALRGTVQVRYSPGGSLPVRRLLSSARVGASALRHPGATVRLARALRRRHGGGREAWRRLERGADLVGRRADVVHVEWATKAAERTEVLGLVAAASVVSCRGSDVLLMAQEDEAFATELGRVFSSVDGVHCVSAAVLAAAEQLGLDRRRGFVVHPAVDTSWFCPPAGWSPPPASPVAIVSVGRAHWVKGYGDALAAVRRLVDDGLDLRYTIIGGGGGLAELRSAVRALDLVGRVDLLGSRSPSEVRAVLAASHVFLLSSVSEGLSNAALEAMSMRLPVVVTDVGGMGEAVRDGVEGFLVPSRDPRAMAERLAALVVDAGLRERMGSAGRMRVCERFAADDQLDRMVDEYRRLMDERRPMSRPGLRVEAARVGRGVRRRARVLWASRGGEVECCFCGWSGTAFLPAGRAGHPNRKCPRCGSLERYRMLWLYLRDRTSFFTEATSVLEVGPKRCFADLCRSLPEVRYAAVDLNAPAASLHSDLTALAVRSGSFDLIVCFHVLEHVEDDVSALAELQRVLRPGGRLLIQVPIRGERTFEDPTADPADRDRLFGQDDHVRWYGLDVVDRVAGTGLAVEVDRPLDWVHADEARRQALRGDDQVLVVARRTR